MKTFETILEKRVGPCYGYECHPTHTFVHAADGAKEPDISGTFWDRSLLTEAYDKENAGGCLDVTLGDGTYFFRGNVESLEVAQALRRFSGSNKRRNQTQT